MFPYSVDIWLHYCVFAINTYGDEVTIRRSWTCLVLASEIFGILLIKLNSNNTIRSSSSDQRQRILSQLQSLIFKRGSNEKVLILVHEEWGIGQCSSWIQPLTELESSSIQIVDEKQVNVLDQDEKKTEEVSNELSFGNHGGCCAICLDTIPLQETAMVKGCEHAYCVTCILRWASYKEGNETRSCKQSCGSSSSCETRGSFGWFVRQERTKLTETKRRLNLPLKVTWDVRKIQVRELGTRNHLLSWIMMRCGNMGE